MTASEPQRETPLVSAVIPTRNRAGLLERALRSVFAQTYPALEIVVVDDGSTDETPHLVARLQASHPQLRFFRNETPLGAPAARNRGIREARGIFVAGLDDDDEWHPKRISRLVDAYEQRFSCVTSDDKIVTVRRAYMWRKPPVIRLDDLLLTNMVGNQVLVERRRLLEIGGFDESLKAAQDYDLWIRLAKAYGPVLNIQLPLQTVHVSHGERITRSSAQFCGYMQVYAKHRGLMSLTQRKYQLYSIRQKTGRKSSLWRMFAMVPPRRWWKEIKMRLLRRLEGDW